MDTKVKSTEWMLLEQVHGKVHVIIRQFERMFNTERDNDVRDNLIFNFIQKNAGTHLNELFAAGQKCQNLQSYIEDARLQPFWRAIRQSRVTADLECTVENIAPN